MNYCLFCCRCCLNFYALAAHPKDRSGTVFSCCPSVCACGTMAEAFSDQLAVEF